MCGWIMCITFHGNMFSCLNFSFTAWAADGEVRKESLSVLSNGSMASSHASETGAKQVGEAYRRKPWTTFSICWYDHFLFFVFEVGKALSSFRIGYEGVLPLREDVVIFFFLVKKVWLFAAAIESVMTMMLWMFSSSMAGIRPRRWRGKKRLLAWHKLKMRYQVLIAC